MDQARPFQRPRFKQSEPLEIRLAAEAARLRDEAKLMRPGFERDQLLRKARHIEAASHMNEWLTSPGLRPPT